MDFTCESWIVAAEEYHLNTMNTLQNIRLALNLLNRQNRDEAHTIIQRTSNVFLFGEKIIPF